MLCLDVIFVIASHAEPYTFRQIALTSKDVYKKLSSLIEKNKKDFDEYYTSRIFATNSTTHFGFDFYVCQGIYDDDHAKIIKIKAKNSINHREGSGYSTPIFPLTVFRRNEHEKLMNIHTRLIVGENKNKGNERNNSKVLYTCKNIKLEFKIKIVHNPQDLSKDKLVFI